LEGTQENYDKLQALLEEEQLIALSSFTRVGLEEVKTAFLRLVETQDAGEMEGSEKARAFEHPKHLENTEQSGNV
ncbi:MAG: hypothetical protein K9L66_04355, partial [Spirochaetaceae bacterium]|nr:hypothetical protein [Spirochaetaceae bacterium]MCF7950883.1 hypothetical protein [Spirochaetaceae bacterium]